MRRGLPEIRESITELEELLIREKKPRLIKRIQVLYFIKLGKAKTRIQAAEMVIADRGAVGRWLRTYEKEGLAGMLLIKTVSNRKPSIPDSIIQMLRHELEKPEGFRSYKAIQEWLKKHFSLCVPYKTVHFIVRYRLKGKLKVGRKSHVKKKKKEVDEFK